MNQSSIKPRPHIISEILSSDREHGLLQEPNNSHANSHVEEVKDPSIPILNIGWAFISLDQDEHQLWEN